MGLWQQLILLLIPYLRRSRQKQISISFVGSVYFWAESIVFFDTLLLDDTLDLYPQRSSVWYARPPHTFVVVVVVSSQVVVVAYFVPIALLSNEWAWKWRRRCWTTKRRRLRRRRTNFVAVVQRKHVVCGRLFSALKFFKTKKTISNGSYKWSTLDIKDTFYC